MKFSIRDLLLVTLIVAILVAWWVDRSRLASELERLRPAELQLLPDGRVIPPEGFPSMGLKGRGKSPN